MVNINNKYLLIINADDYGKDALTTSAIAKCFQQKIIDRTTIMVSMPNCDNAVKLAKEENFFDNIGLHLNLTEGVPLTEIIKDTALCENGVFNNTFFKVTKNRFFVDKKTNEAILKEIEAQIKKYLDYGFTLKHIDSHQYVHTNPTVMKSLFPLLNKYRFNSIRFARNIPLQEVSGLKGIYKKLFNYKINSFNTKLQNCNVKYFGAQDDMINVIKNNEKINDMIEIAVHPTLDDNGNIKDALYKYDVQAFIQNLNTL